MPILNRTPRYAIRARSSGTLHWICPFSGHLNFSTLDPTALRVACSDRSGCAARFVPGVVLWPTARGRGSEIATPPDCIIPIRRHDYRHGSTLITDVFPQGDLGLVHWTMHNPVHVLVNPQADDVTLRLFVRHVRQVAEGHRNVLEFEALGGQGEAIGDDAYLARGQSYDALARLGAAFTEAVAMVGL